MNSINYIHDSQNHNQLAAKAVLPFLINILHPKSILDIGCGTGTWLSVAKSLKINDVLGIDGIKASDSLIEISNDEFLLSDLTQPVELGKKFDLALCMEVAEHLPSEASENIIDILTSHSDIILFSAAIPGQGGQYHLNEQWPTYWQKKFKMRGFEAYDFLRMQFWETDDVNWWYKQNMILYSRRKINGLEDSLIEKQVASLIHPSLYEKKQYLISHFEEASVTTALKILVKSLLRSVGIKQ